MTSLGNRSALIRAARQLRADHLVVVERDAAVRLEPAGLGLADVVHAARRSRSTKSGAVPGSSSVDRLLEDGQRVLVDVLVAVVLVDLQRQPGQLGQHLLGQPGVDQQREPAPRRAARRPA